MVLNEDIADDLTPLTSGGITLYPAASLERIFDWADRQGRTLEWLEAAFYDPKTRIGELALRHSTVEREGADYTRFRHMCLGIVGEFEAEATEIGMGAYFEIGISD
jgi:hypothetical protein